MSVVDPYTSQPIETVSGSGQVMTGSIYFNEDSGSMYVFDGDIFIQVGAGAGTSGTSGTSGLNGTSGTSGNSGDRYTTTSNSSVTIGSGAKSFTLVDVLLAYSTGQPVIVAFDSNNYMTGTVTSYNTGTNVLSINVTTTVGGGTYMVWSVSINGAPGSAGTSGVTGTSGTSGVTGTSGTSGVSGGITPISGSINIILYDGGNDLTTGIKDTPVMIPYSGSVTSWDMLAFDSTNTLTSTSAVVDILSDTLVNLPLSATDSIAGTEKPTLSSQSTNQDTSITTWSQLIAGNYIQAEIESVSAGVAKLVVNIKIQRI